MRARLVALSMLAALVAGGPARAKDANEGRLTPFLSSIGQQVNHLNHQIAHFVTEATSRPVPAARDSARANMREGITVQSPSFAPELVSHAQPSVDAKPKTHAALEASSKAANVERRRMLKESLSRQNRQIRKLDVQYAGAGTKNVHAEIIWEAPTRRAVLRPVTVGRWDHLFPGGGNSLIGLRNLTASDALLAFAAASIATAAGMGALRARRAYKEFTYID